MTDLGPAPGRAPLGWPTRRAPRLVGIGWATVDIERTRRGPGAAVHARATGRRAAAGRAGVAGRRGPGARCCSWSPSRRAGWRPPWHAAARASWRCTWQRTRPLAGRSGATDGAGPAGSPVPARRPWGPFVIQVAASPRAARPSAPGGPSMPGRGGHPPGAAGSGRSGRRGSPGSG